MTQPDPLQDITARLKLYYDQWKSGEKDKDKAKKEFFEEISKRVSCDERLIEVFAPSQEEARALITQRYPLWEIDDIRAVRPGPDDLWEVIISENPVYKKYTYFNPANKLIYERQLAVGAPVLDDDRLKADDPDLYYEVTEIPHFEEILRILYEFGDDSLADWIRYMERENENFSFEKEVSREWRGPRSLKDLGTLADETLARLQDYIYEGKPSVRLAAPRKATKEELSELE